MIHNFSLLYLIPCHGVRLSVTYCVTQDIWRSECTCLCPRYNLRMHWWITI